MIFLSPVFSLDSPILILLGKRVTYLEKTATTRISLFGYILAGRFQTISHREAIILLLGSIMIVWVCMVWLLVWKVCYTYRLTYHFHIIMSGLFSLLVDSKKTVLSQHMLMSRPATHNLVEDVTQEIICGGGEGGRWLMNLAET